tara:strand:- start:67 stop:291 length:225 start_codon:yes stop_codon:yes gene_type:complete
MTDEQISSRDFGHLEAQVAQLREDMRKLQTTVDCMAEMMSQARGGWRAIALVGGIAGTLGGAIAWIIAHIKVTP